MVFNIHQTRRVQSMLCSNVVCSLIQTQHRTKSPGQTLCKIADSLRSRRVSRVTRRKTGTPVHVHVRIVSTIVVRRRDDAHAKKATTSAAQRDRPLPPNSPRTHMRVFIA